MSIMSQFPWLWRGIVDFNKLIARVKNILLTPKTEWPVIAGEPETVQSLYLNYILILAAIPAVFGLLRLGFIFAIFTYVLGLLGVFVLALIIDALAPSFGGQKNQVQALKTVAYAHTPTWIAGVTLIVPFLGWLVRVAAAIYGIYLFYVGLPQTMKNPPEKTAGYMIVSVIIAIVIEAILGSVVAMFLGVSMLGGAALHHSTSYAPDPNSALGALAAMGQRAEEASKKMDAAKKSGDANAQAAAAGQMMSAVLGGGAQVEALAPDALKPFVPDTLAGMPRTSFEVQKQAPIGFQVSMAEARYGNNTEDSPHYELTVTDMGGAKGMMSLLGFANIEQEKQTEQGWEKTYHQNGRLVNEKWDNSGHGEYTIVVGDRFVVGVKGSRVANMDVIKAAVAGVNLAGLEALKAQGVKNG